MDTLDYGDYQAKAAKIADSSIKSAPSAVRASVSDTEFDIALKKVASMLSEEKLRVSAASGTGDSATYNKTATAKTNSNVYGYHYGEFFKPAYDFIFYDTNQGILHGRNCFLVKALRKPPLDA